MAMLATDEKPVRRQGEAASDVAADQGELGNLSTNPLGMITIERSRSLKSSEKNAILQDIDDVPALSAGSVY